MMVNELKENFLHVEFRPSVSISGHIKYHFPVMSHEGLDLLDEDFGTGKLNGDNLFCCNRVAWNNCEILTCELITGNKGTKTHGHIKITRIGGFAAGANYDVEIDEIKRPNIAEDDRHIELVLEGYNGAAMVSSSICYDFSLKKLDYDEVGEYNTPALTSVAAGDSGVTLTIKFTPNVKIRSDANKFDFFIIEFPRDVGFSN